MYLYTALLSLPSFLKLSASFAYGTSSENRVISADCIFRLGERFSWAMYSRLLWSWASSLTFLSCSFMGQLTLARFRGDTTFGLVARIISTFVGGLTGAAIWHISTGGGKGNPYGLAVTCAVAFPFFFYGRLYWPGPPVSNTIFFTTTALVGIHRRKKVITGADPCSRLR